MEQCADPEETVMAGPSRPHRFRVTPCQSLEAVCSLKKPLWDMVEEEIYKYDGVAMNNGYSEYTITSHHHLALSS